MKKLLLSLLLFIFVTAGYSQPPACPNVTAGPTQTVCNGQCATLTSTLVTAFQTTSYSVSAIPYAPYAFTGTAWSVGVDDIWSPVENIGFDFCFFGTSYSQCILGSNGQVSFGNLGNAGAYDGWPCTTALPSTNDMPGNMICAAFRDIDPAISGNCYYQVYGAVPCRYAVITWDNVPLFSCLTPHSTFQCVLYENTNFIDVFISNSSGSCAWNGGDGIVGIQNAAATVAVCPPGRNFGAWTATNEAWRFTPTGAAAHTFTWTGPSAFSSTLQSVAVCPTTTSTYTATMVITNCDGATFTNTATQQVVVTPGPAVTVNNGTICNGGSTTLTAGGATTYSWTPATGLSATTGASVTASPTVTTTYTVTGTTGGCTGTAVSVVTVGAGPTVTVNSATICKGNSTTLTAGGATTYSWTPATGLSATTGASVTANPTVTTTYTITGTTGGCTGTVTSVVTVNPLPVITVTSATVCPGSPATLTAGGANTYTWSTGGTGSTLTQSPLTTTNYTVTGTSASGCVGTATTAITVQNALTVAVNNLSLCNGATGVLNATGAATYSWSPAGGLSATTGASVNANPATTTNYTVVGTSGTCTASAVAIVTINPLPVVTMSSATVCVGTAATLTAGGANTYTWNTGATGTTLTQTPATTTSYTVTGTSVAGCTNTATGSITVNPLPVVTATSATICPGSPATLTAAGANTYTWSTGGTGSTLTQSPLTTTNYTVTGTSAAGCVGTATTSITVQNALTVSVNNLTICNGGIGALNASGAATYSWSPAGGLSATTGASVNANPTTTTNYTVVGTSGTCTASAVAVVTVNPLPAVTVNSATVCTGTSATMTAAGANTYSWSTGGTGTSLTQSPAATTSYTITGTSVAGCTNTATAAITVNPLPTVTVNNGTICNGGSVILTANGAATYSWNPAIGLSASTGASVTANPLATTSYTITGTDANGCVNTATTSVTVVTNPTVTVNTATICVGSSAVLTASGAVTYSWTPAIGLSATTGTSVTANPTAIQVYTITGTAGTCTAVTTTTVNVNPLPVVTIGSNSPVCVNQTLNLTSGGGTTYSWTGPNTFSSALQNPSVTGVTVPASGVYSVTVTDANACVNTGTVTVVVNPLPVVTATGATVCLGATINLGATGGVNYSWSGPGPYTSNQQNPSITNATLPMAGSYVVTVTDANGCVNANVAQVVINPSLVIAASSNSPICQNASLNLAASTGVSWVWSGPNMYASNQQNPSIPNAQPNVSGTYTVVGTDANGCQGTATTNVVVNPLPVVTSTSATICIGTPATLTAAGALTYTWNTLATGSSLTTSPATTTAYTVVGTDNNGCVNFATASITVNPLPVITVNPGVICAGNSCTLTANGAVSYNWNPVVGLSSGTGSPVTANPTSSISYTVTGTDINNCVNTATTSVTVNPLPNVTATSTVICAGIAGSLTASGANTYVWSPATGLNNTNGATVSANPAATTTYTVVGFSLSGCSDTITTVVTVNPLPVLSITPLTTSGCAPLCVSFANTTTVTGTCSWAFGDGSSSSSCAPNHCFTGQGTFLNVFTLTDGNGCVASANASVVVYPVPVANFNANPQPTTILDPNIQFSDATTQAVVSTWGWTFGDPNNSSSTLQNPSFIYNAAGSYPVTLIVTSDHGCKDSTTKIIIIADDYGLYIPNAFTPNFDGLNDIFLAVGEGINNFKMYIFDRWGNQVFYSDDITKGWDGTFLSKSADIVQQDVYVWKIELTTFKGEPKTLSGHVSLVK